MRLTNQNQIAATKAGKLQIKRHDVNGILSLSFSSHFEGGGVGGGGGGGVCVCVCVCGGGEMREERRGGLIPLVVMSLIQSDYSYLSFCLN